MARLVRVPLIAWAGEGNDDDEQIPLCRIEYLGDEDDWGFAIYDHATATHTTAMLGTGEPTEHPKQCHRHRRPHPPRRLPAVTIIQPGNC